MVTVVTRWRYICDDRIRARIDVDHVDLAPRSTPPFVPQKKGLFEDDEFSRLQISSKQIRRGKKVISIERPEEGDSHVRSKAAIMSALAAFDSDDDERDDTYDVADVGGAVDNTVDTDGRRNAELDVPRTDSPAQVPNASASIAPSPATAANRHNIFQN